MQFVHPPPSSDILVSYITRVIYTYLCVCIHMYNTYHRPANSRHVSSSRQHSNVSGVNVSLAETFEFRCKLMR